MGGVEQRLICGNTFRIGVSEPRRVVAIFPRTKNNRIDTMRLAQLRIATKG